ncbi:MAG: TIM barrel protein [Clostridiales bacterium]|nr:TIM barrel protein [Clostridiales bacterium]MCF8021408.1 TIM barrel protein [Clostridiales bacterium]
MGILFGAAGNTQSFYDQGYKSSLYMPGWLNERGLNAYEYQCTRGVNIKQETAQKLGQAARDNSITLSIHGPYYINLATDDQEKQKKTKGHIIKSLQVAKWMQANKVVFHPGSASGASRIENLEKAKKLLYKIIIEADKEGLGEIKLAPETMGKASQLGNLEEVLDLCKTFDNVVPTIDFAHLHALGGGCLNTREDFAYILDRIAEVLSEQIVEYLHVHFSPIEYTRAGEKKHRTLLDEGFGPVFEPLAELIVERDLCPTIICESKGRQVEDVLIYKEIYNKTCKNKGTL